jgi:hypothetical protein
MQRIVYASNVNVKVGPNQVQSNITRELQAAYVSRSEAQLLDDTCLKLTSKQSLNGSEAFAHLQTNDCYK